MLLSIISICASTVLPQGGLGAPVSSPAASAAGAQAVVPSTQAGDRHFGERVPDWAISPGFVEDMAAAAAREAAHPSEPGINHRARNGAQGMWKVPSIRSTFQPRSGDHYAYNEWGDTHMAIDFNGIVDLEGAWIAGQGTEGSWARELQAIGYRDGVEVERSAPFTRIGQAPSWFAMDLAGIDRVELVAQAASLGRGFYSLDDLCFVRAGHAGTPGERIILTFDDLDYRASLTGSGYGELTWEVGTGDFAGENVVHAPQSPKGGGLQLDLANEPPPTFGGGGTLPILDTSFVGPYIGDPGAGWLPPDTCGAVGIEYFIAVVNQHISIYRKSDGSRVHSSSLQNWFGTGGGSAGDPRVAFDPHHDRWVVMAANFNNKIYISYSLTSDPTGAWYKTDFNPGTGADAGHWPDYPTLGVDARGIYLAAYMVGSGSPMSIFAIDKAPLLTGSPSLGTITAFRGLPWEYAIQPCVTWGDPGVEYLISRRSNTSLRLRRIEGPMTAPTLVEMGNVTVPNHVNPPSAPALGSTSNLSTVDQRPMNAVYRNGSIWTAHTVSGAGRAVCRWYEVDVSSVSTNQVGTISDPTRYYFFPSIAVDALSNVVLGFSGSHSGEYAGTWYSGRKVSDPPGETAAPAVMHAGEGPYNIGGGGGSYRWGDYSLTSTDPVDDSFWTIQEYARAGNNWGTWIGKLSHGCGHIENYCVTSPNSVGTGCVLFPSGSTSVATNDLSLLATGAPPGQFGIYFFAPNQVGVFFGDGILCAGGGILRMPVQQIDTFGFAQQNFDNTLSPMAGLVVPGSSWNFQFWYRDPAFGGAGFNTSDAVGVLFCE